LNAIVGKPISKAGHVAHGKLERRPGRRAETTISKTVSTEKTKGTIFAFSEGSQERVLTARLR